MSLETMTKLQTVTVGAGGASSIDFTSIPQTYTDLVIKVSARRSDTSEGYLSLRFNSDSGSNYSNRALRGTGSASSYSADSSTSFMDFWVVDGTGYTSNVFASADIYVHGYSGFTYKSVTAENASENNSSTAYMQMTAGIWTQTSPVTRVTLYAAGAPNGTFAQYTTATLYGVKNAAKTAGNSIKATGGNIIFDGTYVYHVFNSTGTFVSTQPLTVNVVSVGGGGGGGWNNAGGGGGGEVDIANNLSIAAGSSSTVTVGAGGATATSTASAGGNGTTTSFASLVSSLGGGGGGTGDATGGQQNGQTGGSGGGGSLSNVGGGASGSNTNIGGDGFAVGSGPERYAGGGGGGATSAGGNANTTTRVSGAGGQGYAIANIFNSLSLGSLTHLGSGGSGGIYVNGNTGTAGTAGTNAGTGGQQSTSGNVNPTNPTINGGGGGGGGSYTGVNSRQGSNGASGLVIIRYKG